MSGTVSTSQLIDQVVEGVVSLGARGPDPHDGYGYEFDLTPGSARLLAERLSTAADGADGSGASG